MILANQRDVMHQLVQEAPWVRQEVKDIKNAMVNALLIRTIKHINRSSKHTQHLQRLTAQEAFKVAMQAHLRPMCDNERDDLRLERPDWRFLKSHR